ncbi:hypothetical protein TNCV_60951 [Trichonephila clavipes]|nr:hypothetical protein TNCV_60951 [Trichonephila clavipes]
MDRLGGSQVEYRWSKGMVKCPRFCIIMKLDVQALSTERKQLKGGLTCINGHIVIIKKNWAQYFFLRQTLSDLPKGRQKRCKLARMKAIEPAAVASSLEDSIGLRY